MDKDYYSILGVEKDASQDDIKKAFRNLSKEHHPDHGGDENTFKEINEAHSVLSNPEKRKEYDNPSSFGRNPFEDIMRGFGPRAGPFMRQQNPNAPRRGGDLRTVYRAPLHIFIFGGEIKVKFSYQDACPGCKGSGASKTETCDLCQGSGVITEQKSAQGVFSQMTRPCSKCFGRGSKVLEACEKCTGSGRVTKGKEIDLIIHPGTRDGQIIGVTGQGRVGMNGGPAGDLVVQLEMAMPAPENLTDEQKKVLEEL